jgi:lysophospholipase L1-like esterase
VTLLALLPVTLVFVCADYLASYANRRNFVPTRAPAMEYLEFDPLQMWRLRKGYAKGNIQISQDGFRSDRPVAAPAGKKLVFVVGSSTVFGVGVRSDQTITRFLQDLTDRFQPDQRLAFVNAGVTGYYSTQELIHIERNVLPYRPYMVIALGGRNDAFYGIHPEYKSDAISYHGLLRRGLGALDPYYSAPESSRLPFHLAAWLVDRRVDQSFNWLHEFETPDLRLSPAAVELFLRNQRTTHAMLHGVGVQHALFLQPTVNFPDRVLAPEEKGLDEAPYLAPLKRAYKALSDEADDSLPREWFRGAIDLSRSPGPLFIDNVHLTESGARLVAEAIYKDIWAR